MSIHIITCVSPDFVKYSEILMSSIALHLPQAKRHVLALGPNHKPMYYAHKRGEMLVEFLEKHENDHIVWVDADSVMVKDGNGFAKHIESCELTMRPKSPQMRCFASGVIGMKATWKMQKFVLEFAENIKRCEKKKYPWYADQKALNATYAKFKKTINFKPLPFKYCDTRMSEEGVLWTAKGKEQRKALLEKI